MDKNSFLETLKFGSHSKCEYEQPIKRFISALINVMDVRMVYFKRFLQFEARSSILLAMVFLYELMFFIIRNAKFSIILAIRSRKNYLMNNFDLLTIKFIHKHQFPSNSASNVRFIVL